MNFFSGVINKIVKLLYDWPNGTIDGMFATLTIIALVGLFAWGLYAIVVVIVDAIFLQAKRGEGTVVNKEFTPATTRMIIALNVPYAIPVASEYTLRIEVDGWQSDMPIKREGYERYKEGDLVSVEYTQCRISGAISIKGIWPA